MLALMQVSAIPWDANLDFPSKPNAVAMPFQSYTIMYFHTGYLYQRFEGELLFPSYHSNTSQPKTFQS